MTDYIKREDAINAIRSAFTGITADTMELRVNSIPSADVALVVRCKDCKHFRTFRTSSDGEEIRTCVGKGIVDLNYDDFCSKGERRGDE